MPPEPWAAGLRSMTAADEDCQLLRFFGNHVVGADTLDEAMRYIRRFEPPMLAPQTHPR